MRHTALLLAAAATLAAGPVLAGPCTDQISELGRVMARSPSLGPVVSGSLQGAGPSGPAANPSRDPVNAGGTTANAATAGAPATSSPTRDAVSAAPAGAGAAANTLRGGGSDARSGSGGTKEVSAAAAQIATSPEDVRRQQEGRPMTTQTADENFARERMRTAQVRLEEARTLDRDNKAECMDKVVEARKTMEGM